MTREEYELEVLRSADADGILHPVPLTDWWAQMSVLMGMYIRAEIDKTGDGPMRERTGPYCIAEAGRARLAAHNAEVTGRASAACEGPR